MADENMRHLAALDELAKQASIRPADFRKAADDLFEKVVDEIQGREDWDRGPAYALAAQDGRAREMYRLGVEKHDEEVAIRSVVGRPQPDSIATSARASDPASPCR